MDVIFLQYVVFHNKIQQISFNLLKKFFPLKSVIFHMLNRIDKVIRKIMETTTSMVMFVK